MEKKRLVVSYKNLSEELKEALIEHYPGGFGEHLIKVNKNDQEYFYAVPFETEDTKYLVKIDVKIDLNHEDEEEEDSFSDDNLIPDAPDDIDEEEDDYDDDFDDVADEPDEEDDEE